MKPAFTWLTHTDGGLLVRVLIGVAVFAALAAVDLRRNGSRARRWREYGVLLISVATALVYGAINDQVTVTISPEYFLEGKELSKVIGDHPAVVQLRWEAAKIGLKATWTAGLIFGVLLLLANNPFFGIARLPNRQLLMYLPVIVLIAAACGCIGGWLGWHGKLIRLDPDFQYLVEADMYRPYRFMSAWGVHLGSYVGSALGTVLSVTAVIIRRIRRHAIQA